MSTAVIIPAYNRAHVIGQALDSVLAQTVTVDEIVVVDDGSTDNTQEVVLGYGDRVRYLRQSNAGKSCARNLGILNSTADYLLFLDSDDVLLPAAVQEMSAALDSSPDFGAAYCGYVVTDAPGHVVFTSSLDRPTGRILRQMCLEHLCIAHSVLTRRSCLAKSGLFDRRLTNFEDIDFFVRVAEHCPFVFVPKHLVEYRRWADGASGDLGNLNTCIRAMLQKLTRYKRAGILSRRDWQKVRARFEGYHKERQMAAVFGAYGSQDWRTAYSNTIRGFVRYPRTILNRGLWAVALKSLVRSLRVRGRA